MVSGGQLRGMLQGAGEAAHARAGPAAQACLHGAAHKLQAVGAHHHLRQELVEAARGAQRRRRRRRARHIGDARNHGRARRRRLLLAPRRPLPIVVVIAVVAVAVHAPFGGHASRGRALQGWEVRGGMGERASEAGRRHGSSSGRHAGQVLRCVPPTPPTCAAIMAVRVWRAASSPASSPSPSPPLVVFLSLRRCAPDSGLARVRLAFCGRQEGRGRQQVGAAWDAVRGCPCLPAAVPAEPQRQPPPTLPAPVPPSCPAHRSLRLLLLRQDHAVEAPHHLAVAHRPRLHKHGEGVERGAHAVLPPAARAGSSGVRRTAAPQQRCSRWLPALMRARAHTHHAAQNAMHSPRPHAPLQRLLAADDGGVELRLEVGVEQDLAADLAAGALRHAHFDHQLRVGGSRWRRGRGDGQHSHAHTTRLHWDADDARGGERGCADGAGGRGVCPPS